MSERKVRDEVYKTIADLSGNGMSIEESLLNLSSSLFFEIFYPNHWAMETTRITGLRKLLNRRDSRHVGNYTGSQS